MVIGGLSATFHGSPRVTYDLDICYSRLPVNLLRLRDALAPFHPRPRGFPFLWDEKTLHNSTILTLQTDIGEMDLMTEVIGLGPFSEVKRDAIEIEAFARRFATLDLPALIRAKRPTGCEKGLSALPELESLLEAAAPEKQKPPPS